MNFGLIDSSNRLWTWGSNGSGELGDNTIIAKSSPVSVVFNGILRVKQAHGGAPGTPQSCALNYDGVAYCWGRNTGDNSTSIRSTPVPVAGNHSFIAICNGFQSFTMALKADGTVWTWGTNNGQLGDNTLTGRSSPVSVVGNHSFIKIYGIGCFTALKADGSVWSSGDNTLGKFGDNSTTNRSSPVMAVGSHSFIDITGTQESNFGLKANGEVWAWGRNTRGQLGQNNLTNRSSPVSVIGGHSFIAISGTKNDNTIIALKADGSVWAWGQGSSGEIGDNTASSKSSPVAVVGNHSFVSISAMNTGLLAFKANGEVWGWGTTGGQLQQGDNLGKSSPVLVFGNWKGLSNQQVSLSIPTFYILTVTSAHGTVSKNPNRAGNDYDANEVVTLTATPSAGFAFSNWTGDITSSSNPVNVTMSADKNITANYVSTHTLTTHATNGTVSNNPTGTTFNDGTQVQLTATPNAGYVFVNWSGSASGTSNPLTITMDADKDITANFAVASTSYPFYKLFIPSFVLEVGNWFVDLFDGGRFKRKIP